MRRCRGEKKDAIAELFPGAFGVVVDAAHKVFDFFAQVLRAGGEIKDLLLPALETVGSGDRILERDDLSSDRDMVSMNRVHPQIGASGGLIGVEEFLVFVLEKVANAAEKAGLFQSFFHDAMSRP